MDVSKVYEVSLDEIKLQGINVRKDLNTPNSKENLLELAESIKINGLMQPIILRGTPGSPPYDVIIGQRRYLAHMLLKEEGLLPSNIIKATFSGHINDIDALLLSLSENMCRQELNYADTAEAITELYNYYNKDVHEVKKRLGLSIRTIRSYIKVEEQATDKIKHLLRQGDISMTDAKRAIDAAQGDLSKADLLVDEISKLTRYEKKRVVEIGKSNKSASVAEIISEARKPELEETVILNLPLNVHEALQNASYTLSIDPEEITTNALVDWLKNNDFLLES